MVINVYINYISLLQRSTLDSLERLQNEGINFDGSGEKPPHFMAFDGRTPNIGAGRQPDFSIFAYSHTEVSYKGGTPASSISRWDFPCGLIFQTMNFHTTSIVTNHHEHRHWNVSMSQFPIEKIGEVVHFPYFFIGYPPATNTAMDIIIFYR